MNVDQFQPCSVAKLLSVVFDIPLEKGYKAASLVLCPICDKAGTKPEFYPYCGLQHQRKGTGLGPQGAIIVDMVCDVCHLEFKRPLSHLRRNAKGRDLRNQTGGYKVFCSKDCNGAWLGAYHGFRKNPTRAKHNGRKRLHDYEAIWARHLETREGPTALARHFQIPIGSMGGILKKMRR